MTSTQTDMAARPVKIADLFSKCSEINAQEQDEMGKIVSTILPVLAWLNEPVVLRPSSLGGAFEEFRSVTLETGALVVMTDRKGGISSKQLAEFKTGECLAILQESFPELQRMVENKRRAGQVKPLLSLKVGVGGSRFLVDRRSYHAVVSNSGGDCVDLRITTSLPGGGTKSSRPCDLARGKETEVDLDVFDEVVGLVRLDLQIDCKDMDGRELRAMESVALGGSGMHETILRRKN